jgi:peroxiredoxin
MTIKVGDKIPSVTLMKMGPDGPKPVSTDDIFAGKKVAFFGVPGAFTPTCSAKHVPGFVDNADALKAKGVDLADAAAVAELCADDEEAKFYWGKVKLAQFWASQALSLAGAKAKRLELEDFSAMEVAF